MFDNRKCRFVPHAAVLTTGSVVDILNSDPILHTVHLYGPSEVNIALPLKGMKIPRTLDRPGLVVVKCDVHGWMQAFLRIDRHPFHAVTDASGVDRADLHDRSTQRPAWLEPDGELLNKKSAAGEVNPAARQLDFFIRSPESEQGNNPPRKIFTHFFAMEVTWK